MVDRAGAVNGAAGNERGARLAEGGENGHELSL